MNGMEYISRYDSPLGGMIAVIKGTEDRIQGALDWMESHHVEVEVLRRG